MEVTDYIEGLIAAKVDEMLQAKADVADLTSFSGKPCP